MVVFILNVGLFIVLIIRKYHLNLNSVVLLFW